MADFGLHPATLTPGRAGSAPALLRALLSPIGRLRAYRAARAKEKALATAVARLRELSPHLLDDIGMAPRAIDE